MTSFVRVAFGRVQPAGDGDGDEEDRPRGA
jgi:hypothetical protein